jgi:hypothetical protein
MYIQESSTSHYSFSLLFTCSSLFHYKKLIINFKNTRFASYKKLNSTCLLLFFFSFLGANRCLKVPQNFCQKMGAQRCPKVPMKSFFFLIEKGAQRSLKVLQIFWKGVLKGAQTKHRVLKKAQRCLKVPQKRC